MVGITHSSTCSQLVRQCCILLVVAALAVLSGPASPVGASTTRTVTNLYDSGVGSLRQAIVDSSSGDTINFAAGLSGTITVSSELYIDKSLTIVGPGLTRLSISGGTTTRVLNVHSSTVTLAGVWIRDGHAATSEIAGTIGGGILNSGTLTLSDAYVSNSSAQYGAGIANWGGILALSNVTLFFNNADQWAGGISNQGTADLRRVTFDANHAGAGQGGGMNNADGTVTMTDVAFLNNTAGESGGFMNGYGTAILTNVSFTNNSIVPGGYGTGSGLSNGSPYAPTAHLYMTLTNVTISDNTAATNGGALYNRGTLTNTNTTIAYNTNVGIRNDSPGYERRYNVITANNTGANCVSGGNMVGDTDLRWPSTDNSCYGTFADPRLGTLGRYDGSVTYMRPLLPGSGAINQGWNAMCASFDQRYMVRPISGTCDIGAYEYGFAVRLPLLRK